MNIYKIFKQSVKTVSHSDNQAVNDGYHIIRMAVSSVSDYFSDGGWKTLPEINGAPRIYSSAKNYFSFGGVLNKKTYEDYLISFSSSYDIQSEEIASVTELFKAAALEKTASLCENGNADNIRRLIDNIKFLCEYDGENLFELLHAGEKELETNKEYVRLDGKSKDLYRYKIAQIADEEEKSETDVASDIVSKTRKRIGKRGLVGFYLRKKKDAIPYILLTVSLPIFAVIISFLLTENPFCFLAFLPMWSLIRVIIDRISGRIVKAEYAERVLPENLPKTLVTTVSFISSEADIDRFVSVMKRSFLTNGRTNPSFRFGLLADLPPCENENTADDEKLIRYAEKSIEKAINEYGNVFFTAIRKRKYDVETNIYSGFERKRGAILEFLKAVKSGNSEDFLYVNGDIFDSKYFVSLDGDTLPDISSVEKLICVLENPLNSPELNSDGTAVKDGFAVAVPLIDTLLDKSTESKFTQIISCRGGTEIYENVSFDLYQDIFGEAVFSGKGAINIDCFLKVFDGLVPEKTMLSHDIIEGSFLRTVLVSDAVFFDSVPKNIVSYGKRSHRWTRGDWQNIGFLFGKIKRADGSVIKNPISFDAKYRIFDNIRRSVTPVAEFILLVVALIFNNTFFLSVAVISFFLSSVIDLCSHFDNFIRFRSGFFPTGTENLLFTLLNFICLPYFAYISLDAIIRSVWRMTVSRKKLLEWTTSDSSDKLTKGSLTETLFSMLAQISGLIFLLRPLFIPIGLSFIFAPFIVYFLSVPKKHKERNYGSYEDSMYSIWGYFSSFMNEKTNYLPPDNYQESPVRKIAERTSPTNIGLALLCVIGAYDMGYIDRQKAVSMITNTVTAVEKLEKINGQFYNWYNISTLEPLSPRFISTVDNGNCAACLYTLKNALNELHTPETDNLADRVEKILNNMDFSFLYDAKKQLFYIGFDSETDKPTNGHYDFYASEARLTSYFCIASGIIPKKHWAKLNRYYVKKNGFLGVKSWNGTAFEYFMPYLLLPIKRCSLDDEMLRFAYNRQKKAVPSNMPWGISESGYYSFDNELNYQYRACGVRSLSARQFRNGKNDSVVSPYSSFLMSVVSPESAEKNLTVLSNLGAIGKYGYYEAVDFPSLYLSEKPSVVMSYMAHHLGMSFIACENLLKNGIMRRRFFDEKMSAFSFLLEQKLPSRVYCSNSFEYNYHEHERKFPKLSGERRKATVLNGGEMSDIITDFGCGGIFFNSNSITKKRNFHDDNGIYGLIRAGSRIFSFSKAPLYENYHYKSFLSDGSAVFYMKNSEIELKQTVAIDPIYPCEIREFSAVSRSENKNCDLLVYFEPVIGNKLAEMSHPAFYGLSVEAEYDGSVLFLHRKPREKNGNGLWLAVSSDVKFEFELSRFNVLSFGGIKTVADSFNRSFSCNTNGAVDPCVALRLPITSDGSPVKIYISCGYSRNSALNSINNARKSSTEQTVSASVSSAARTVNKLCVKNEDINIYEIFLEHLCKGTSVGKGCMKGEDNLYKYGISDNSPIILIKTDSDSLAKCKPFVGASVLLSKHGVDCQIVFCFYEGGDYERRINTYIRACFRSICSENLLDNNGSVRLVNLFDASDYDFLCGCSEFTVDLSSNKPILPLVSNQIVNYKSVLPQKLRYKLKTGVGGFLQKNGNICFGIDDKAIFPSKPAWTHVISKGKIGTVLTDSDLGFTFYENAGLMKLTPWSGDALTGCFGERLIMSVDGKNGSEYDLLAKASCVFGKDFAEYKSYTENAFVTVKIYISERFSSKICDVSVENRGTEALKISYIVDIIMNGNEKNKTVVSRRSASSVFFENPFNTTFCSYCAFISGEHSLDEKNGVYFIVDGSENKRYSFILGCSENRTEAEKNVSLFRSTDDSENGECEENSIKINTPSEELNCLYNGFLYNQILTDRINARTGFYQCSGAYGFRDQLQDCICISTVEPEYLRKQILLCCKRQFEEGDVLHWWHELKKIKGSRTRSSDDLLWLPYAVCEYIEKTSDYDILKTEVPYVSGRNLANGENEAYIDVYQTEKTETVIFHCIRAIKKASTVGKHGLVLFGGGDWNDGMNNLFYGESVFSTLLLINVLERFSLLCPDETAEIFLSSAKKYREAIEENCWENDRYLRGFYENGSPLGSQKSDACQIDILPQSFVSIVGNFDGERVKSALSSAYYKLFDKENKTVKLFTPPFESDSSVGYISSYINGVRENGGQYTHAAVWFALALIKNGQINEAMEIIDAVNPINHSKTLADVIKYRTEPYSVAADIYSNSAHVGMGGWTHYTGSAGWFFKTVTEDILGIKRVGNKITMTPNIPASWNGFTADMKIGRTTIHFNVLRNGQRLSDNGITVENIPLDGNEHNVSLI